MRRHTIAESFEVGLKWLVGVSGAVERRQIVLISVQSLAAGDDDPAIVRCEPSVVSGPATTTLTVDLYVENAVNLYGADIRITFDTTAAQVVDADPRRGVIE